ncbi:MAG: hypothetical protein KC503_21965 [Myxococcales bacterium]|nr:hypothetical protein [Myxococcales bacterium]
MITIVWLSALLGPPLVTALWALIDKDSQRTRIVAIVAAVASCMGAVLVAFVAEPSTLHVASALRMTDLSRLLVMLPPGLWLVTVTSTPNARLERGGLGRTGASTAVGIFAFLTASPVLLACCWAASSALFLRGIATADNRRTRRVVASYHVASLLLLVSGIVAMRAPGATKQVGLWLVIGAVLVRKGIYPFHAWIPEAFDHGRIGPTVLLSAPQLGTYVAAILVVPQASPATLRIVAILSLLTAVYGAALALYQSDARRTLGYLFVSQSALVLAGLDCTSGDALAGAIVLWGSSALAFTGIARTVLSLEARRGRLSLTTYHGGFDRMPLLAASFLLFGLACTGFPGTLGFIGHELLIDGAVRSFPVLGFLTIAATALTGLTVLRMYFSLFCGKPDAGPRFRLRVREAVAFGGLAAILVASGVVARPVARLSERASAQLLRGRSAAPSGTTAHTPRRSH